MPLTYPRNYAKVGCPARQMIIPPTELVEERSEHYNTQTRSQMNSVDNNLMRENDPRMPLFNEGKTKVTFGNGT